MVDDASVLSHATFGAMGSKQWAKLSCNNQRTSAIRFTIIHRLLAGCMKSIRAISGIGLAKKSSSFSNLYWSRNAVAPKLSQTSVKQPT